MVITESSKFIFVFVHYTKSQYLQKTLKAVFLCFVCVLYETVKSLVKLHQNYLN